ncbi:MAG: OmpA family protein, partial [Bacteroidales bacterium]|nr:OmpA family protein [Bacteroidales bacterium]
WGVPQNLGDKVNTFDSEAYPYISDGGILTFASQGHAGFGGYDLFSISLNEQNAEVINLGSLVNTSNDDFSLVYDDNMRQGYFTSNKNGTDDIYYLYLNHVIQLSNKLPADTVIFRPPSYRGKLLEIGDDLATTFELEHIYYDFNSDVIKKKSEAVLDTVASILNKNPEMRILVRSHTDVRGSALYNKKLSERRAKSAVEYLQRRITEPYRVSGIGCGEEEPVNRCINGVDCSEEEHEVNRRSEFIIVRLNESGTSLTAEDIKSKSIDLTEGIHLDIDQSKTAGYRFTIVIASSKTRQGIHNYKQTLITDNGFDNENMKVNYFKDNQRYRVLYKTFKDYTEASDELNKINIEGAWIMPL